MKLTSLCIQHATRLLEHYVIIVSTVFNLAIHTLSPMPGSLITGSQASNFPGATVKP
jgi:hypothetical protein